MSQKNKMRYLKKVIIYCLAFTSAVVGVGLCICWRGGHDPTGIVSAALTCYGTELGFACLTKILEGRFSRE